MEPAATTFLDLARLALALGAESVPSWSTEEKALAQEAAAEGPPPAAGRILEVKEAIRAGADPLGDTFCALRNAEARRALGQTYTPPIIVQAMLDWATDQGTYERIVDPGTGSGRYLVAAGRCFPSSELLGADIDPLAALLARGHLAAAGLEARSTILLQDYRTLRLSKIRGRTLFAGNPPYVRHHHINAAWKKWLQDTAREAGYHASGLAGLHVYFFLATLRIAARGDRGAFITSAEWLDVNYGAVVRDLLLTGLGGTSLHVIDPEALPFQDAATTAVITTFEPGAAGKSMRVRRIKAADDLGRLDGGKAIARARMAEAPRWTPLLRVTTKPPDGYVELGELCRVHRGCVTGSNKIWIMRPDGPDLPESVLYPSITKARELFLAGEALTDATTLRKVIDLPADLDELDADSRRTVERFLRHAKRSGAADSYVARNRKTWWRVGLREPAPILATYMARRPPAFVRNFADARHINIAHGIYPREPLNDSTLDAIAAALRTTVVVSQGRTYAGGLTKFEPREMERLLVPNVERLTQASS